jgi:hypothetical protein
MQNTEWYAETAYDSLKKEDVPPPDPAGWSRMGQRNLRAHVLPLGVHCGEYRYRIRKDAVRALKKGLDHGMATHEQFSVPSFRNPLVKVALFRWLGGIFSILGLITSVVGIKYLPSSSTDINSYWFFLVPFSIFIICSILERIVPNKNNILFNRRTGMVTIPKPGRKPPIVLPFAECDGYYFCHRSKTGWSYSLYLGHRFTPQGTILNQQRTERHTVSADWEFFQQYMDINLPLPDTPGLEPYRHLDPTTAEYDRKHNRPPHYWLNLDLSQVNFIMREGFAVIEKYPWHKLPTDHIPQDLKDKVTRIAKRLS